MKTAIPGRAHSERDVPFQTISGRPIDRVYTRESIPNFDYERELNDRFGKPPAAVRNLLYIVRVRVLAKRAHIAAIVREEGASGQSVLLVRTADGVDLREQIPAPARRELERMDGVTLGHTQMRIDLGVAGASWREILVDALEAASGAALAA